MQNAPPKWPLSTKRIALYGSVIVLTFFLYQIRFLILPLLMSMVLAYIILPVVNLLNHQLRVPRVLAITLIYAGLLTALVVVPARITTPLVSQFDTLIDTLPDYFDTAEQLLSQPIFLPGDRQFVLTEFFPLDNLYQAALDAAPQVASISFQYFDIFGNVASYTALTVGWILFSLFVSFYLVKDYEVFLNWLIGLVPEEYEWESYQLAYELGDVWNSFLRGQIILFFIMGITVFTLASIIGLPNALFLGIIAAFAEFVPQFGPMFVTIPAVLIAFFQNDQSWLGAQMSPMGFAILIGLSYFLLNQISGYFVAPRVLGRSLNMHPLIVFLAALGGAVVAGILGILLASPLLASGRVIFRYIYCKLRDIPPYPQRDQTSRHQTSTSKTRSRKQGQSAQPSVAPPAAGSGGTNTASLDNIIKTDMTQPGQE